MNRPVVLLLLLSAALTLFPLSLHANAPFVTDDADVVGTGQFEMETWLEYALEEGDSLASWNSVFSLGITDWLEGSVGAALGLHEGSTFTAENPTFELKSLLIPYADNRHPGVGLAMGYQPPVLGRGILFSDAHGLYAIAPLTASFWEERLFVHANLGLITSIADESQHRVFWGFGLDAAPLHPDYRILAEINTGDDVPAVGLPYEAMLGFRWIASERIELDVAARGERHEHDGHTDWDWAAHLGLRVVFDAFQ